MSSEKNGYVSGRRAYIIKAAAVAFVIALCAVSYAGRRHGVRETGLSVLKAPSGAYDDGRVLFRTGFVTEGRAGEICHVSSVAPLGGDRMACVWYQGSREGAPDVAIYLSIYDERGMSWTEPVVLMDRERAMRELARYVKKLGNPMIMGDSKGRLWLFYASVAAGGWSGASINYTVSADGGRTWSRSTKMVLSPFFNLTENVKNKGVELDDGSFIVPVYQEFVNKVPRLVRFVPDAGKGSYEIRKMSDKYGAIQPSLIRSGERELTAFFRNMGKGGKRRVLTSRSADLGASWSEPEDTTIPNPDSGLDFIRLDDGNLLGVLNDSFRDRSVLSLVVSGDGGRSWRTLRVLESAEGGEYSYPSISRSPSGTYHVSYTYERRAIKHISFNEAWVRSMR